MVTVDVNLNRELDDFEWSVRTRSCFLNAGITTLRDLVQWTESRLLLQPNFGDKSLAEVKGFLIDRGLRLGMDLPPTARRAVNIKGPPQMCVGNVHLGDGDSWTKRGRINLAEKRGHPPQQCGNRASHKIDGDALCRSHAGQRALKILEGEG